MAQTDQRPQMPTPGVRTLRVVEAHEPSFAFDYDVHLDQRATLKGHAPHIIWLTGLSGSGKSTVANHVEAELIARGTHAYVLDGDSLRAGLSADLGFTPADRRENVRRVAEVAALMYDAGLVVIVALISPFRVDRAVARSLFPTETFTEVYVDTPIEVCESRDTKGLYARSAAGTLQTMTGRGQRYEVPDAPDLVISGTSDPVVLANRVLEVALGS